jgi:hypothetical protein
MIRAARHIFFGLALTGLALAACAGDAVTIRYLGGQPLPGKSSETVDLRITRFNSAPVSAAAKQEIDRYFENVSAALAAGGVTGDWQLAIPDAPSIEITIEIGGKKLQLVSCHTLLELDRTTLVTERGAEAVTAQTRTALLANQSESFRRHRLAFEKILRLTLERSGARLSPDGTASVDMMTIPPGKSAPATHTPNDNLVILGTVTGIRDDNSGNPLRHWVVTVKVDRVISGIFSGKTFSFAVHSPTQSGLEEGRQYQIRASGTINDGYAVDEHQWKRLY